MIFLSWEMPLGCFGHFVFMCSSLTFLFHMDNTFLFLFFFFLISFGEFQQENYINMLRHYGSRIVEVFLGPLNDALGSKTDILWWYRPYIYGGLCPIYFFGEFRSNGSIFVI